MNITRLKYKWTLEEDFELQLPEYNGRSFEVMYHHNTLVKITPEGKLVVRKGYSWDGCTPKYKISVFDKTFILGVWDGFVTYENKQQMYYISLVHDALCQIYYKRHGINFYSRKDIDVIFKKLCGREVYKIHPLMKNIYYYACRGYGNVVKCFKGY